MSEKHFISDLAGHCNEATAWKILKEISQQLLEHKEPKQPSIDPFLIEIREDGHFVLTPSESQQAGFDPHECGSSSPIRTERSMVWTLGATVFYAVMGRQVMNDKGGLGQTENSKLPYLRSEWPALSELVQRCLNYDPEKRPSLKELHDKATEQYDHCLSDIRRGPKFKDNGAIGAESSNTIETDLAFWPETMQSQRLTL